ncbi:MAG: hypothetical protein J6O61_03500 [Butyrivibrio sp.]|uniref:hypothetical protein n=1 Tax=Butyrivibrio sp. TaxID=28121 RepID=UPI001B2CF2F6|nr:hypothetical protein [Butyrivibrio sp.]MBO6239893.1 hypothetical protein [Butyrivibrio sp.]
MKIHFDKLYKDDRNSELCGIGIPFAKGEVTASEFESICIMDGEKAMPSQFKITSKWNDGSIRYVFARFLANLPGNADKDFELEFSGKKADINENVTISEDGDCICVSNGNLSFKVKNNTKNVFEELTYEGRKYAKDEFSGPVLSAYGEKYETIFDRFRVVEKSEIFSCLEADGRFIEEKNKLTGEGIRFTFRIYVTAGKPWIECAVRLFNCTDADFKPDSLLFEIKTSSDDKNDKIRTMVAKSNYRTNFTSSDDGSDVSLKITAEMLEKEANEHFAEVFYGTFFADRTNFSSGVGICATVYQAQQNYPKAVKAGRDGISVFLIPDQNEMEKESKSEPVIFSSGMAREQKFLLHFHSADLDTYEINNRSLIYQMPDVGIISPEVFEKAGVMPDIFLPEDKKVDDYEISLIDKADNHVRCYGMLNWGDGPDPGYTSQGRGGGRLVWTNNEYDYPHAMYMMYARSGIRRFLDYANVAAMHWMDVDVCHYSKDELQIGGQWEHINGHTGGSKDGNGCAGVLACSHEWVEGLLDYYHFSGDERALETALGIGDNVLKLLDTPMFKTPGEANARETGWALRSLTALFLETGDAKWTKKCSWIVSQFESWNDKYGHWLAPYTDNTTIRVGFMISVAVGSLMRYYRVFPSDELKKMIIGAIDDLVENQMTPYGLFYYKELPSLSRNGNNPLLLEAMAIAYELTGNDEYLEKGIKTFRKHMASSGFSLGQKKIIEDSVIVGVGAPKAFAQGFLPLAYFYTQLVKANKLLSQ